MSKDDGDFHGTNLDLEHVTCKICKGFGKLKPPPEEKELRFVYCQNCSGKGYIKMDDFFMERRGCID